MTRFLAVRLLWTTSALLSVLARPLLAQQRPGVSRDSAQRIVSGRVATGHSAGLVVGVISPEGRYVVAAGDERAGKPLDDRSIFEIGSITKVFTGILLAEMAGRGEVRLDQPVAELLAKGTRVPARGERQITLLDLATQTSGLPRLPDNMKPANPLNPYADYTVAQLYDFLSRHELRRDPGTLYEYSNLGVGLLGLALSLRAGKSYEALVRERILDPLGMTSTGVERTRAMNARAVEGRTAEGEVVSWWDMPTLAGAGALRSSLRDMMAFLAAVMQPPGTPLGRAIAASQQPHFQSNAALALGLNWHLSAFRGDTLVWHNGGTGGFRTLIAWNPKTRSGAVLLGSSSQDNEDVVRHILLGLPLANRVLRKEIAMSTDALQAYVGTYDFSPQFAIRVFMENGTLFAQATDQPRVRLYAESRDTLFFKVVDAQLLFARDALGNVNEVTLVQGGARPVGKKRPQ